MDRQAQIDLILDHYENPRHRGPLPGAMAVESGSNPGCGDAVTFYLRVDSDGRISGISFDGEGCTISQAASSMTADMFFGRTVDDVEAAHPEAILDLIGSEMAGRRARCATLGFHTLRQAVQTWRRLFRDTDNA